MRITFKAFASLGQYLPAELGGHARVGNQIDLDLPEGATVQAVIERFTMPRALVHLVLVNGVYVPPGQRLGRPLREGDALAVWPPVAGG